MKIRTGTKVAGSSQFIECELEDSDMQDVEGWADLPVSQRWKMMTKRGDSFVVEYMLRNDHISQEYAAQRMQEIRGS